LFAAGLPHSSYSLVVMNTLVEHRRDDIDEGHVGDERTIVTGREVRDGTHQQATGAPTTHAEHPFRIGYLLGDQKMGHVDEVGEGIAFVLDFFRLRTTRDPFLSPPRICAIAYTNPRSTSDRRSGTKRRLRRETVRAAAL
jgi:hypothetical protein